MSRKPEDEERERRKKAALEAPLLTESQVGAKTHLKLLREECRQKIKRSTSTLEDMIEDDLASEISGIEDDEDI